MFAQFFGNFLLNNKLVTPQQLAEAIELKKTTRLKLGVLAINAGFMTAEQVEQIHQAQQKIDKRFGDIAVDKGFLTESQVSELLSTQKSAYLLLGQALVDKGYMSNSQFEEAITAYKTKYHVSDEDLTKEQEESIRNFLTKFYDFGNSENEHGIDYITLLFNNIVRFIGDDFIPLEAVEIANVPCENLVTQKIVGPYSVTTAFEASSCAYAGFASRFAGEDMIPNSEMADAAAGEFLNLHNGLFTVNMSNDKGIELNLTPQDFAKNTVFQNDSKPALKIPLSFSFGTVNFLLSIQ